MWIFSFAMRWPRMRQLGYCNYISLSSKTRKNSFKVIISTFPLAIFCLFKHHDVEALLYNNGLNSVYATLGSVSFIKCRRPWILKTVAFRGREPGYAQVVKLKIRRHLLAQFKVWIQKDMGITRHSKSLFTLSDKR